MHNRSVIEPPESLPSKRPQQDAVHRRFVLASAGFTVAPLLLFAAFVIAVDPYYVFGSPSWRGFNQIRTEVGKHLLVAKPYQLARLRPRAVALGSSRVETGIDPQHPGWTYRDAFNFALPASNSYAVLLAFLHAQTLGARQAVVGLDFFGFNAFYQLEYDIPEQRFLADLSTFVASMRHRVDSAPPAPPAPWDERLYLAVNQDVANAISGKFFKSGREHYDLIGRAEGRKGDAVPLDWDETGYLQAHPDVAMAIARGDFISGTSEALPTDTTPMLWFWDASHYRKATGDLILDRIFDFQDPARALPADFGVRMTAANIDAHLAGATARRAAWAAGNSDWESIMHSDANRSAEVRQRAATCW
jgi:hypothetical protein